MARGYNLMKQVNILLLIAAYVRKTNHPEETDEQLAQGVILDLQKIRVYLENTDLSPIVGGNQQ